MPDGRRVTREQAREQWEIELIQFKIDVLVALAPLRRHRWGRRLCDWLERNWLITIDWEQVDHA